MSRPSIWQDKFDREQDFEVLRPFKVSGIEYDRGDAFDKSTVTTRTLRQLYDSRRIKVATVTTAAPASSGALTVEHLGFGRYAVFKDGARLTKDPLTKAEAEAYAAG